MEKLSRVLAVLIAVLSVVFMGFAGVVSFGGPNWEAEAESLEGYTFLRSEGQNPIWTATRAADRQELSTKSALLPEVLVAAIKDRTDLARQERDRLAGEIPTLEQQTKALAAMQEADVPALDAYYKTQNERLSQTHARIEAVSKDQETLAAEIRKVEDQLASRREDVFRLELEYQVLTADTERVKQNVAVVEEQIRLLEDELDKTQRRQRELDERGIPAAEYFPAGAAQPGGANQPARAP
jgi:archaellum component FlaC